MAQRRSDAALVFKLDRWASGPARRRVPAEMWAYRCETRPSLAVGGGRAATGQRPFQQDCASGRYPWASPTVAVRMAVLKTITKAMAMRAQPIST